MKSRKTLYTFLLLALTWGSSNPINVLAMTENTTSEPTATTELPTTSVTTEVSTPELPTTSVTTEVSTTTVAESLPPNTEVADLSEASTSEELETTLDTEFESGLPVTESATSIARGDDYPANLKNIPYYSYTVDPWSYYHRQCTSFVAFRLVHANGFSDVRGYGNATEWGNRAKQRGYTVNKTPAYGSVAWFSSGHVAWVSDIRGSYVEIEEYNVPVNSGNYKKRLIPISSVTGFIHFKDIKPSQSVVPQSVTLNKASQTLTVGNSFTLTATVKPNNASNKSVKWTSSNKKVATVVNGKVTAITPGQAIITATTVAGGKTAKARITVQNKNTTNPSSKSVPVYRLYNPSIKRHLYTQSLDESAVLKTRGWNLEGSKFNTAKTGKPVYRLYNTALKEHLYTTNKNENDILATRGWKAEGIAWYSSGKKPVYRLYHPELNIHLYTTDKNEVKVLVTRGWIDEKVSFYTN